MIARHIPVLLNETVDALRVQENEWYIDATLGAGGHTTEIVRRGGRVIGIDQDEETLADTSERLRELPVTFLHGNFARLAEVVSQAGIASVAGILFDLGVSSMQLDQSERGFSFLHEADLDMRMSKELAVTAKDLVNALGKKELYELFTKYAQEQRARTISEAIVRARRLKPIRTTKELADIIVAVYGGYRGKIHKATKVFQALRMAVNDEANTLKEALPQALDLLKPKGRLAIISFHEGEDRIVKQYIKEQEMLGRVVNMTPNPITPHQAEITHNPRSRSAKLRIAEKI